VGLAPLPTLTGEPGHGVLGGYQLAVNALIDKDKRELAIALVRHLTSLQASVDLAVAYGRSPARRDAYDDARLVNGAPLIAALRPAFERARPRPVTPYYMMFSDVLQGEFSAAITGVRAPEAALGRAQSFVDHLMGAR
jgi:multiple sugar transport system substrate-binding protein